MPDFPGSSTLERYMCAPVCGRDGISNDRRSQTDGTLAVACASDGWRKPEPWTSNTTEGGFFMTRLIRSLWLAAVLAAFSSSLMAAAPKEPPLLDSLAKTAPTLKREVLRDALAAMGCAVNNGSTPAERLAVIDFSLPSSQRRLWIFDLKRKTLLLQELVAHGQKSGENFATSFSNLDGSHQSSIGLFRTQETYFGQHGYSLRMDGLEPGINDRARERAIVIHPADYVRPGWIKRHGRIGRSHGCPAVRPEVARMVVDSLKGGQFMFSWYPDRKWMRSSAYLNCKPQPVATILNRGQGFGELIGWRAASWRGPQAFIAGADAAAGQAQRRSRR